MNHSTGKPTKADVVRFERLKGIGCICCHLDGFVFQEAPVEIHHLLSGNRRRGHRFTLPLCRYHHRGVRPYPYKITIDGDVPPSLTDGSKPFRERYGSDNELLARVDSMIGAA